MARTSFAQPADSDLMTTKNLTRTLTRLDEKLARPTTPLERARASANLEYARQLVHMLESQASAPAPTISLNASTKRQKLQSDLVNYKQTIRRLNEALHAASTSARGLEDWISAVATDEGYDSGIDDGIEEQAVVEDDIGTEPNNKASEVDDYARLNRPSSSKRDLSRVLPSPTTATATEANKTTTIAVPQPSSAVRQRFPGRQRQTEHQKRQVLFGQAGTKDSEGQNTEALLDDQRREQESITEDLVKMAQMLKSNSLEFGKSLEEEKVYLQEASQGLDRNTVGLDAAGRRIEDMRKKDSVNFYWTVIYLASMVVLAFFILFILFFAPKLRWW
ncbi:hypothetical protein EX30DRAFT_337137 [Ascodesmis nigricans]|uniref:Uncharacterized protein n=1 Tax=Ascodesmis nigricans TaxID=341454 RepID=A0A4S2N664_9PEZI|nr:hypothetical protein EX30DRAFT_337137 [Ascodesmis nigricans]